MSKETAEIIQGAVILVPFLVLVVGASKVLAAFTNARFNQSLTPLIPVIGGTLRSDGIHGVMTGTYRGKEVGVQATTGTRSLQFPGHSEQKRNLFTIEINEVGGAGDWRFAHGTEALFGRNHWHLRADDEGVKERLDSHSVIAAIEGMGNIPVIHYSASQKRLTYIEDIAPSLAPSPERFQSQLDLLEHLAKINEQVSAAGLSSPAL